jgi:cytochrome c oxidase subunit 2
MGSLLPLPPLASAHGGDIDQLLVLVHLLILVVFVGWSVFLGYTLWRFRARRQRQPVLQERGQERGQEERQGVRSRASGYAEIAVVVAEVILLVGFSIPLWSDRVEGFPAEGEALEVRVVAQQFAWNVHYPGPDGVFGTGKAALVNEETNPLGLDPEDPAGDDDVVTLNQLHLPVHRPVILRLSSKDVIHGFALPEMRVKLDAIPGVETRLWFEPTVTTEEMRRRTGDPDFGYEIACAQLCGNSHYSMRGFLTVETPEAFEAWMAGRVEERRQEAEIDDFWL